MIEHKQFILRGLAAGIAAGLLAFIFSRIFAEPIIQHAIDYESGRDAAQQTLDKAAGLHIADEGKDPFTRGVQRGVGIGTALILFGAAMGGIFSVTYISAARRWTNVRPRVLALGVAGAAFLAIYLLPFLKYPANPPSIGHPDTIKDRSALYLVMVIASIAALAFGMFVRDRLAPRMGGWNAALAGVLGVAVLLAIVMIVLPPLGHLHENVKEFGRHATETPLPLKDPQGHIVFPGFPADDLFRFRLYAVANQFILWTTTGLIFGALVERMAVRRGSTVTVGEPAGSMG